jgi:flagellar L-ring protein precursor FlgH
MNYLPRIAGLLFAASALTACVTPVPSRQEPMYKPVWPQMEVPKPASAGSLYAVSHSLALFDDRKARNIGDVITIILEESTRSSKSAETSIKKGTKNEVLNPKILGSLVQGSGGTDIFNSLESSTEFEGEGESDQSNSLSGTLTAVVANVLPNGLMLVQGEKWFQLNRGEEYVRVSGLVRPEDVRGNNTVSSQRLADARIAYSGTGELAQANEAGWLTRFFFGTVFPF